MMPNLPNRAFPGLPASLGAIEQICFITTDIPASVDSWVRTFGAGPFFHMEHVELIDSKYHGQPADSDHSVALGYWNDLQIEFVHQHNDTPTIFSDWTIGKRTGLHHAMVRSPDVEQTRADLAKIGMRASQEARVGMGGEYIYFETGIADLPFLEVVRLDPLFDNLFDYMKRIARDWDGADPLREVPPMSEWASRNCAHAQA